MDYILQISILKYLEMHEYTIQSGSWYDLTIVGLQIYFDKYFGYVFTCYASNGYARVPAIL